MAGRIIGMIPRNFIVVLLENHMWYDDAQVAQKGNRTSVSAVSNFYRTAMVRQASEHMSQQSESPRGSESNIKADILQTQEEELAKKKDPKVHFENVEGPAGDASADRSPNRRSAHNDSLNKGSDSSDDIEE